MVGLRPCARGKCMHQVANRIVNVVSRWLWWRCSELEISREKCSEVDISREKCSEVEKSAQK